MARTTLPHPDPLPSEKGPGAAPGQSTAPRASPGPARGGRGRPRSQSSVPDLAGFARSGLAAEARFGQIAPPPKHFVAADRFDRLVDVPDVVDQALVVPPLEPVVLTKGVPDHPA